MFVEGNGIIFCFVGVVRIVGNSFGVGCIIGGIIGVVVKVVVCYKASCGLSGKLGS